MTQPTADPLRNLVDRAERGPLTGDEAQRLRDGIRQLHDWLTTARAADRAEQKRAERAEAALTALHHGEEPHTDDRTIPTPAQWIWRWNRATPEQRLEVAADILSNSERTYHCVLEDHPAQIERLRQRAEEAEAALDAVQGDRDGWRDRAHGYRTAVNAVRRLHEREPEAGYCAVCSNHGDITWPCATIRALDAHTNSKDQT
ncbi:hypothetical protein AB0K23_01330 [Streptomyces sp. NPDC049602]|uniref:hypothetical protein n=1 Tax=Streptomyces sp. NPDC049602 TaxID=3155504 RepID=UPI00342E0E02